MKLAPIAIGLLATVSLASPASARGGPLHLYQPASTTEHIDGPSAGTSPHRVHHRDLAHDQSVCKRMVVAAAEGVRAGENFEGRTRWAWRKAPDRARLCAMMVPLPLPSVARGLFS